MTNGMKTPEDKPQLSHISPQGEARMVDVADKPVAVREATASALVTMRGAVLDALLAGTLPKGDALATARVAAILGAKRTSDLIPMCHPLGIDGIQVEFARVDPERIVRAVRDYHPSSAFGSPAMWNKVSAHCLQHGLKLTGLRRVLIAGAPVDWRLIERLTRCLEDATEIHTPYGATEALPVASVTGGEILGDCCARTRSGAGICVGKIVPGRKVEIIRIVDGPIGQWSADLVLPPGQKGEIVVSGEVVTKEYASLPEATAKSKIVDGERVWHRLGDIGYFDETGRLWYCGRKAHRVETEHGTLFSVCCEAIFNEHPDVQRSALVGVGPQGKRTPVIVVEPKPDRYPRGRRAESLRADLLRLGQADPQTRAIGNVLFHQAFPVDVRHNAKIDREALALWAAEQLR